MVLPYHVACAGGLFPMNENRSQSIAEAEVRKIVEDWASAVRRRDIAAIRRNHSADILMFDVPPPFQSRGIDAYEQTWDLFFSWARDPAVFDIKEMHVTAGEDVAFVTAAMRCAGREASGRDVEIDFRLTIGVRKIDGQWVIVHEHHSVPADK
jgi:ketosteroid isomerase-like protein